MPDFGGALIASNHVSYLDPPAVGGAINFRQTYFMARDTLNVNPFAGWWLKNVGVIPIDRTKGDLAALKVPLNF